MTDRPYPAFVDLTPTQQTLVVEEAPRLCDKDDDTLGTPDGCTVRGCVLRGWRAGNGLDEFCVSEAIRYLTDEGSL